MQMWDSGGMDRLNELYNKYQNREVLGGLSKGSARSLVQPGASLFG